MTRAQAVLALGFVLALCAGPARAQSAAGTAAPASLSLRQAVIEAVQRNPNRVRAGHEAVAAGYQRDAAEWGRFPTVSVDASTQNSSTGGGGVPATTLRVDQPIWAGGRIDGQIDAARAQLSASELAEAETRRRVAEDTAVAYLAWMSATERLEIGRAGVELLQGLLRYVQRRETEGVASSADVAIATARVGQILSLVAELRGAHERARAELENLLTIAIERGMAVNVPPYPESTAAEVEAAYLAGSKLVAQRRAEVDSARAQVTVRQGGMLPRLSVRMENLTYQNQNNLALNNNGETRFMLVLQFAPEAGLASYSGYQAAGSRVDAVQAQLAADENDLRLRARANWTDYGTSRLQVSQIEPQLAALEVAAASYARQFEAGRKSWLDVLNTHRETIDTRLSLSRNRSLRDQAALRLMVNSGTFWSWLEAQPR